jgi:MFS family permease
LSPATSGYALLGFLLGTTVGATFSGRLTMRVVRVKIISIIGATVSGLALIALGLLASQTSLIVYEALLVVIGFGLGTTFPVTTVSVQNGVDQQHLGVATGMLTFLRSLGAALGVAVLGAIALGYGIPLGAEAGGSLPHVTDTFPFAVLFYANAGMMFAGAIITALMPHKQLRGRNEGPAPAPAVAE